MGLLVDLRPIDGHAQQVSYPYSYPYPYPNPNSPLVTIVRNRRRMIRAIYELRHGIIGPANAAAARRCPYI